MDQPIVASCENEKFRDYIVVIFGFGGAPDSTIAKFSKIYEKRGITTLRYTANMFGERPLNVKDCRDVTPLLPTFDRETRGKHIIFHFLSLNGIFTFGSLYHARPSILRQVVAVIFDSCPVDVFLSWDFVDRRHRRVLDVSFEKDIAEASSSEKQRLIAFKEAKYNEMKENYHRALDAIHEGLCTVEEISCYHLLLSLPLPHTLLCIYSDGDWMCDANEIHSFASHHRSLGRCVSELRFADSSHMEHFRVHPKEYENSVNNIIDQVAANAKM